MLKALTFEQIQDAIRASKARCAKIHAAHATYRHGKNRGVFQTVAPATPYYCGHAVLLKENKNYVPKGYVSEVVVPVGSRP